MVRVETVLDTWNTIRKDAAQAVEDFAAHDLEFRPVPGLMTFREIARHILYDGHTVTGLLLAGADDFRDPATRARQGDYAAAVPADADAATLAAVLRAALETRTRELAAQPAEFFAGLVTKWDGMRLTRLELIQVLKEHELAHRAQMFLYLRLNGIVPVTTRRRQGLK